MTAGNNSFHIKFIKKSYRFRGKQERIHKIKSKNLTTRFHLKKKIILLMKEKAKIIEYSPRNNKVKEEEEYSVLNPLTNSDSPSVKSKGARFVSAKRLINHNGMIKKNLQKKELNILLIFNSSKENLEA